MLVFSIPPAGVPSKELCYHSRRKVFCVSSPSSPCELNPEPYKLKIFSALVGSVTLSNAPGSLGDIFNEDQRTLAFSLYSLAPMNGPVLGPIVGGFVYQGVGWRWINWLVLIIAVVLFATSFAIPETYTPVLMRQKAERKRKETGDDRYMSRFCHKDGEGALWALIRTNLKRPLIMLFTEPIW